MSFFKSLKKPYLIAEIGVNHECSIIKAKKMIRLAKLGGADAVKFQTFTADNIEVDKNKVLKVVAAQPSKLTINGLSEFIDTYSDISKDDVRIAKNDTILFKNIDKEKKYSESVFLNRSTGELIHEVTKNMNTKDNEKYISFFGCTKEL